MPESVTFLWDPLFSGVVFVLIPIYTWRTYDAWVADVRERGEPARIAGYRETIVIWVVATLALLALWISHGRPWSELGLRLSEPARLAVGLALSVGLVLLVLRAVRGALATSQAADLTREALRDQLGDKEALIPTTRRERLWFRAVSINAGISEELIFRGFLLWYLEPWVGLPFAVVIAIGLFALAHLYQGWANLPAIAVVAALMFALYLISGSIWLPIVVHALIDVIQGEMIGSHLQTHLAPPRDERKDDGALLPS